MSAVLVTGSPEAVEPVVAAVRAAGAEAVGVTTDVLAALEELEPGSVGCYVQLPVGIAPSGDTAVSRVHSFLEQGLLTRFRLVDAVMPALAEDATVLLVGGHTQVGQQAPDDQSARRALLTVLAHALRADGRRSPPACGCSTTPTPRPRSPTWPSPAGRRARSSGRRGRPSRRAPTRTGAPSSSGWRARRFRRVLENSARGERLGVAQ
jgi:hypothetical protein